MKPKSEPEIKEATSSIGTRVMEFRRLVNLNQREFSQKLETTQASISQIEAGKCLPSGNFIVKLQEVFPDVNLHWLFQGSEKPFRVIRSSKEELVKSNNIFNDFYDFTSHLNKVHEDAVKEFRLVTDLKKKVNK